MTLQDLIDELTALTPSSARGASVRFRSGDVQEFDVLSVCYMDGEVVIDLKSLDDDEAQDEDVD